MMNAYEPRKRQKVMLDRALEMIGEVPYKVSARWLFYRLLQEGFFKGKGDYKNKFLPSTSKARHAFYGGWRPYTLADETRQPIIRGGGFTDSDEWIKTIAEMGVECNLSKWENQDYYVELWFEARAMTAQFENYTDYITLRPMAGQPSIPFKWDIAKDIEERENIVILYFGDLDPAGEIIGDTVERDVRKWCGSEFDFIRCGLTRDQVDLYDVPENPDNPGEFQWEALPDSGAAEIIKSAIDPYISHDVFTSVIEKEKEAEDWLSERMNDLLIEWSDREI